MTLGDEIRGHLPFLRRYARALTGSQQHGDNQPPRGDCMPPVLAIRSDTARPSPSGPLRRRPKMPATQMQGTSENAS